MQKTKMNCRIGLLLCCMLTLCAPSASVAASRRRLNTQLIHAVAFGGYDQVGSLLKKGADVNARDDENRTALITAAFEQDEGAPYCYPDIARLLVQHGAHVNVTDEEGNTALMCVAQVQTDNEKGAVELARYLIAHHARVSLVNKQHQSALQLARQNNMLKLAKVLADASHRSKT